MFFLDPVYFLFALPPLLLGFYAQWKVKSSFEEMSKVPARMSGAQAARRMLDNAGLSDVEIEQVGGKLSDHYDPRHKVLRLSSDVYNGQSMAAVGVACHEAGHAFQDAKGYAPLAIRNLAVPAANFGSSAGVFLLIMGLLLSFPPLAVIGLLLFACVVFFQVVNLPVEFNASSRAREELVSQGIIAGNEEQYVAKVLNAAALTYVAGTLQSIMTLLYYGMRVFGNQR
ncbi:MAG: zinc metallopeptidase [Rhodopirellula sp.]|nr:zinc metallopeptidase [Rhodopirellula sp.]OUX50081.1 MAG: zinc metallopeptidase [Rhodopirellula sp. TMED283]